MLFLSFVWLFILITELVAGPNEVLYCIGTTIWVSYIFYFVLRLLTTENRTTVLKKNWLFILAILVSILRFLPIFKTLPVVRLLTATFGMQAIWIFASADQGMRSIRRTMGHRGVEYALAFTVVVIIVGAAGMLHFERNAGDPESLQNYPKALWWTAMQMTNIGSSYVVKTTGGRAICLGVSVYAAAMFGYLTAMFATIFIGRDAKDPKSEIPNQKSIQVVHDEVIVLKHLMEEMMKQISEMNKRS